MPQLRKKALNFAALAFSLGAWFSPSVGRADEKLFGYTYEAELLPKGALELEQWATNLHGSANGGIFDRWQVREEWEAGLTEHLTGSVYLNFNSVYTSVVDPVLGLQNSQQFSFDGVSTEWRYLVLSPETNPVGFMLYFEPRYSGTELELEGKLILQANLGSQFVFAMNLVGEDEFQYDAARQAVVGEGAVTAGLGWKFIPSASLALELVNDRHWPDNWGFEAWNAWYLGPALHYASDKWWVTFTILPQIHGNPESIPGDGRFLADEDAAKVQTRLIAGIEF